MSTRSQAWPSRLSELRRRSSFIDSSGSLRRRLSTTSTCAPRRFSHVPSRLAVSSNQISNAEKSYHRHVNILLLSFLPRHSYFLAMSLKALWKSIDTPDNVARSSHGLAIVQDKLYIFGGELKPRTPVEGDVAVLNLDCKLHCCYIRPAKGSLNFETCVAASESSTLKSSSASSWPASRVGASFTSYRDKIYLWGGRGGTDMGTFSGENGIWEFDVATKEWRELETRGEHPEPRSFHTMCALDVSSVRTDASSRILLSFSANLGLEQTVSTCWMSGFRTTCSITFNRSLDSRLDCSTFCS